MRQDDADAIKTARRRSAGKLEYRQPASARKSCPTSTGWRCRSKGCSRCAPAASSCTARMTAPDAASATWPSRSRPAWPSAPAIMARRSGCLEMIEQVGRRERPRNALDLGTGSAVLAIALAKLLHIPVLATDIDPVATRVAAGNARLNQVAALVDARTAPGFHDPAFRRKRAVRPDRRQHPGTAADEARARHGALCGAGRLSHPVGHT